MTFKKGYKMSEETKEKIRQSRIGKRNSPSTQFKKGHKHSTEMRLKLSKIKDKGKTILKELIRKNTKYLEWRSAVFQRDNYHCIQCGRGGKLNADHIIPLKEIVEKFEIKNTEQALKCKELWDVGNGRTLCVECHKKTDTYGWKYYHQQENWQKLMKNSGGMR